MPYLFSFLIIAMLIGCTNDANQNKPLLVNKNYSLIPQPQSFQKTSGTFIINEETVIVAPVGLQKESEYLKSLIEGSCTFQLKTTNVADSKTNHIELGWIKSGETPKPETYSLTIDSNKITIYGVDAAGVFRGIQTLRQLFHPAFHAQHKNNTWGLEGCKIEDYPTFAWRGMLFDCSRHFFSKNIVKKYIDLLAYYKMNTLHWHLTEDQGWRIAIDQYPLLTMVGAWRKGKDGKPYGGFYTKEDIREIVTYAQQRHINIVPEIELPGHSQAAIAAYPFLSCTGEKIEVGTEWGVFKDVYCAGNDSVFQFLENVLSEVVELFPSPYIHIGGDECPKYRWEHCPKCQHRIKTEHLKDEHELQSYFIKRIASFLESKGKKIIGWDEILEGGLAPNAMVQSWRGMDGALQTANLGQYAIASPTSHAYFDYKLDAIDLEKVYSFNPIPTDLEQDKHRFILGGECNMWTEWVPNDTVLDNKVFPRILAMSEVLWLAPQERNYEDFYNRVQQQYPSLDALNVQYGAETIPIRSEVFTSAETINIKLQKGAKDLELFYTLDNTEPTTKSTLYEGVAALKESATLKVQAFKNGKAYGELFTRNFTKHLGNGIEPTLSYEYSSYYTGGGNLAVTNGARGSSDFRDGNWQAVQKVPMEITIDLKAPKTISRLETAFFQKQDSWIFLPTKVEFYTSTDGKKFTLVGTVQNNTAPQKEGEFIQNFELKSLNINGQYVRMKAYNIGFCPSWHAAAGSEAWLFVDEVVLE